MNEQTRKVLDRLQRDSERSSRRRPRRFTTAPLVLALGLILADVLLTRIVPMIWETLLPGGLEQADHLVGWAGLVWRAAVYCHFHQRPVQVAIGVATVGGLLACRGGRLLRIAVWLSAVGVIALNAAILIVTIRTSLQVTARSAGLDLD
jgi:hypothetical protein